MSMAEQLVTNLQVLQYQVYMNIYQHHNTPLVEDVKYELNGCLS